MSSIESEPRTLRMDQIHFARVCNLTLYVPSLVFLQTLFSFFFFSCFHVCLKFMIFMSFCGVDYMRFVNIAGGSFICSANKVYGRSDENFH